MTGRPKEPPPGSCGFPANADFKRAQPHRRIGRVRRWRHCAALDRSWPHAAEQGNSDTEKPRIGSSYGESRVGAEHMVGHRLVTERAAHADTRRYQTDNESAFPQLTRHATTRDDTGEHADCQVDSPQLHNLFAQVSGTFGAPHWCYFYRISTLTGESAAQAAAQAAAHGVRRRSSARLAPVPRIA